jgi:hypothetical protein
VDQDRAHAHKAEQDQVLEDGVAGSALLDRGAAELDHQQLLLETADVGQSLNQDLGTLQSTGLVEPGCISLSSQR